jgi:hypothetical protein
VGEVPSLDLDPRNEPGAVRDDPHEHRYRRYRISELYGWPQRPPIAPSLSA